MALVENDPSARIQFRRIGELQLPASCYVCGSGTCDEGYIDFGTFVDFHGHFYLCVTCTKQSSEVIGYYSPEEVKSMVSAQELALQANSALEEEVEKLREHNNALTTVLSSAGFDPDRLSDVAGSKLNDESGDGDVSPNESTDSAAGGESKPKESTKGSVSKRPTGTLSRHFTDG